MKNFIYSHRKFIICTYLILTFIKFFTMNIYHLREEDPTIYFKLHPTVENTITNTVEKGQLEDYYFKKYNWFKENQYWEIIHSYGGMQDFTDIFYDTLIVMWWVLSAFLISYAIYKLLKDRGRPQT